MRAAILIISAAPVLVGGVFGVVCGGGGGAFVVRLKSPWSVNRTWSSGSVEALGGGDRQTNGCGRAVAVAVALI